MYYLPSGGQVPVDDIESLECPVSLSTPEIRQLINIESENRRYHSACGAAMYGSDPNKWPAWWADTVNVLEIERIRTDEAKALEHRREMDSHR